MSARYNRSNSGCGRIRSAEWPMNRRAMQRVAGVMVLALGSCVMAFGQASQYDKPPAFRPTDDERRELEERTAELEAAVAGLPRGKAPHRDALADVAVYAKAGTWALRYGEFYARKDVAMTLDVLRRGLERAKA